MPHPQPAQPVSHSGIIAHNAASNPDPVRSLALFRYEEMRLAVEQCARIDEAAEIRDKASALQAYARQRDDRDLDVWFAEIKLRANVRIGELVRELDAAPGSRTDLTSASQQAEVQTKEAAVRAAGIAPSTARNYQELAGPREERAQKAGKAAAEVYFAKARATKIPGTMEGLKQAVTGAVQATVGPKPDKPLPTPAAAREIARATGEGVLASDNHYHFDVKPEDERKQQDWYQLSEPITALAAIGFPPARGVDAMLPSQVERIRQPLVAAIAWLKELQERLDAKAP